MLLADTIVSKAPPEVLDEFVRACVPLYDFVDASHSLYEWALSKVKKIHPPTKNCSRNNSDLSNRMLLSVLPVARTPCFEERVLLPNLLHNT